MFQTQPPTHLTITQLCDKFDTHGTICDVCGGRSGRPRTATSPASSAMVLEWFTTLPRKLLVLCSIVTCIQLVMYN